MGLFGSGSPFDADVGKFWLFEGMFGKKNLRIFLATVVSYDDNEITCTGQLTAQSPQSSAKISSVYQF